MPRMFAPLPRGGRAAGGALGCLPDRLYEEVAYLAYHLHWPYEQLMALDHVERRRWLAQVSRINGQLDADAGSLAPP